MIYSENLGVLGRVAESAFVPAYPFPEGTAQERKPENVSNDRILGDRNIPLWNIKADNKQYNVSKPIEVRIYTEDDMVFVESETLVVIGVGNSVKEALEEFGKHIVHFHTYYNNLQRDNVIGDAIRLKKIYETLFEKQK